MVRHGHSLLIIGLAVISHNQPSISHQVSIDQPLLTIITSFTVTSFMNHHQHMTREPETSSPVIGAFAIAVSLKEVLGCLRWLWIENIPWHIRLLAAVHGGWLVVHNAFIMMVNDQWPVVMAHAGESSKKSCRVLLMFGITPSSWRLWRLEYQWRTRKNSCLFSRKPTNLGRMSWNTVATRLFPNMMVSSLFSQAETWWMISHSWRWSSNKWIGMIKFDEFWGTPFMDFTCNRGR